MSPTVRRQPSSAWESVVARASPISLDLVFVYKRPPGEREVEPAYYTVYRALVRASEALLVLTQGFDV